MKINQHTNLIKDLMHFPVVSVGVEDSIRAVESVFKLYSMNILPVLAKEEPVGLITRNIVEKAIHHKLEEDSVEELMIRRFSVIKSDEFSSSVIPIVIKEGQKLIPVVDQANKIVGVLSRDDIFRVIKAIESGKRNRFLGQVDDQKDIESLLKKRLGQELLSLLERISQAAENFGVSVYMVGGFVRDLLLNVSNKDIDIVVEGDGIEFASVLVDELGGKVKSHKKFGTSVVILPNQNRIDVATARLEHYDYPAALPTIKQSSVKDDLFRRDFT
ncbi:MAG: CBS domain-containing protein, partial [Nitrospinota bacterium]|nr:CBS domain-containing protein [Nitrospinota bacterium]